MNLDNELQKLIEEDHYARLLGVHDYVWSDDDE